MMKKRIPTHVAASVHQRLLLKARETRRPFNELLQYYAMERFMYRLSRTRHVQTFVLKGALMFLVWRAPVFRPTKDIDLLSRLKNDVETIISVMRDVCRQDVESDGMTFDAYSIKGEAISEDAHYKGVRLILQGSLGHARVLLQLDVGFGDIVTPPAKIVQYPTILNFPSPRLYGYGRESAIAEKFQAMIKLGTLNSRMKDFYDIWFLSQQFDFSGRALVSAIQNTLANRKTEISAHPVVFEESFGRNPIPSIQWGAFIRKSHVDNAPSTFAAVVESVTMFLGPVATALFQKLPFDKTWIAPGPWR